MRMSKKKKTLKQKITADLRHAQYRLELPDYKDDIEPAVVKSSVPRTQILLYKDLRKTVVTSILIITSQVVLYFLLKNGAIKLPFTY